MSDPVDSLQTSLVRLLLVEDDPADSRRIQEMLEGSEEARFEIAHATSVEDALRRLHAEQFQVVLLDLSLEEGEGLDTLARAKVAAATVPIIVMTTQDDETLAVRALRFGAQDYLVKGESDARLVLRTVRHAVERHRILIDLAAARQREHHLATHDGLTGLPNRSAFLEQLRRTVAYSGRNGKKLALLFLDLDRFKGINDSLGHPVGDNLLQVVAERLSGLVRSSDMVARLGGDEFIVLLQNVERDHDPARVAEAITRRLTDPCSLEGREYRVTASIGIAVFPRDGTDPDVLIRNADTAMYHAKSQGLNRYSYYAEEMNALAAGRLELEHGLREAIAHDRFLLHYQPQVDIGLGAVYGAEALVRWRDPKRGIISPVEFIPMAEETGMIHAIGEWVLRSACREAATWPRVDGRALRIGVNVSSRQVADRHFAELVGEVLGETGLRAGQVELELTESSVLPERGVTLETLESLRKLGVRIAIDDFGTGYSALTALRSLPIDALKIDRSFVSDITMAEANATITSGLVTMARGLGLLTTAEGVETREQMQYLYGLGCHRMQGYLFGKPMQNDELLALLSANEAPWERDLPGPGEAGKAPTLPEASACEASDGEEPD